MENIQPLNNRLLLKEKLLASLEEIQTKSDGSPVTDLKLDKTLAQEIEQLTMELERVNPNPNPGALCYFFTRGSLAIAILHS